MQKHLIVIAKMNMDSTDEETTEKIKKQNLRHECIHAFFMESGLAFNSNSTDNWAVNEEMIDWFAIQAPKIFKVFQELDIL